MVKSARMEYHFTYLNALLKNAKLSALLALLATWFLLHRFCFYSLFMIVLQGRGGGTEKKWDTDRLSVPVLFEH